MTQPNTPKGKPAFTRNPYFRFFSTVRFAIPALFAFAAAMIYGTVAESLYGTEYVRYGVYHTWWFYLIQVAIVASIILAVVDRLPFRKQLTGFYLVHLGLLIMMTGAIVTNYFGVDGSVSLDPGVPNSKIRLNEDVLYLSDGRDQYSTEMPKVAKTAPLGGEIAFADGTKAMPLKFLPFAGNRQEWRRHEGAWSSEWRVKNDQFEQVVQLADQPGGSPQADLGPLHIEVISPEFYSVLQKGMTQKGAPYLLFNAMTGEVVPVPQFQTTLKTKMGELSKLSHGGNATMTVFKLSTSGKQLNFFPSFSALPVNAQLQPDESSEYRFISLEAMKGRSTLFLSRFKAPDLIRYGYGKGDAWTFGDYTGNVIQLPWMGFQAKLVSEKRDMVAQPVIDTVRPQKDDKENMKAVLVRVQKDGKMEDQWFTNRQEARFDLVPVQGFLGSKEIPMPISMTLERFKMDQVPGTDRPASYESFVRVKSNDEEKTVHIYMNNPFKAFGYTFYQSSYFQDEQGQYHSVLSVNRDPGRPIKYGGALFLVIAMIVHYLIVNGQISKIRARGAKA